MKGRALAKLGGVMMVALGALVPMDAKALPLEETPEGFARYLNNASWDGSSSYSILNAYNCKWDHDYYDECRIDYEEISPLGKKTCVNVLARIWNAASKSPGVFKIYPGGIDNFFETEKPGECSDWEKVSATPEPQPAPTPPTQEPSQPKSSPSFADDAGFTKTQVLVGGVFLLSLGVAIGGAVVLISRKKD